MNTDSLNYNEKMYDVIFITTYIDDYAINDLINSIITNNYQLKVALIVVNQTIKLRWVNTNDNVAIIYIDAGKRLSLSAARNYAINHVINNNIKSNHVIFPDDDTTFDKSFFKNYPTIIEDDESYIMEVYCQGTNKMYKQNNFVDGWKMKLNNWNSIGSVYMIVNYSVFIKVGLFDESLGAGTNYGSSEDVDYYIRCCKICSYFNYSKKLRNFHPSPIETFKGLSIKQLIKRFNGYGKGAVYALCKNHLYFDAFIICLRAMGGAAKSILSFNFRLSMCYFLSFFTRVYTFFMAIINYDKKN